MLNENVTLLIELISDPIPVFCECLIIYWHFIKKFFDYASIILCMAREGNLFEPIFQLDINLKKLTSKIRKKVSSLN